MTTSASATFSVDVDVANPGQFFACCGLLELAHRLWPGAEGWFSADGAAFTVACNGDDGPLGRLVAELTRCEITGLTPAERAERDALESKHRQLRSAGHGQSLSKEEEERRNVLGTLARTGTVRIEAPFGILLDWWQTGDDDRTPKTWAGRQEIHKIARANQDALRGARADSALFDHACVLRLPPESGMRKPDYRKAVEPFYFDARRSAPALDAGFSLDVQDAETVANPAVELLCLIALERFRPTTVRDERWSFEYGTWSTPLPTSVAMAVVCGAVSADHRYRFPLLFRDAKKRYKAFGLASPVGGEG